MFLGNRLGLGRVRPLGVFAPSDLANQVLWLDASDSTSLGNPSADDPISSWLDLTASNNDMSQATGTEQPLYKASGFGTNSKPYLEFDGSNDFFDCTTIASTQHTTFSVYQADGGKAALLSDVALTREYTALETGGSIYARTKDSFQKGTGLANTNAKIIRTTAQTGQKVLLHENGSALSLVDEGGDAGANTGFDLLGKSYTTLHSGKIAEVIMYDRILTGAECTQVEDYLNSKYGLY